MWNLYDSGSWCAEKTSRNGCSSRWLEQRFSWQWLRFVIGICRSVRSHLFSSPFQLFNLILKLQRCDGKCFQIFYPHLSFAAVFVYTLHQLWHFSRLSHFSDRKVNRKKPISNGEWTRGNFQMKRSTANVGNAMMTDISVLKNWECCKSHVSYCASNISINYIKAHDFDSCFMYLVKFKKLFCIPLVFPRHDWVLLSFIEKLCNFISSCKMLLATSSNVQNVHFES